MLWAIAEPGRRPRRASARQDLAARLPDACRLKFASCGPGVLATLSDPPVDHYSRNRLDAVRSGLLSPGASQIVDGHLAVRAGKLVHELDGWIAHRAAGGENFNLSLRHLHHLREQATPSSRLEGQVGRLFGVQIGKLGEQTGVSAKTLRYYEGVGLLPPPSRTTSGYRDYGRDAIDRVRFIKAAQSIGLTLGEIKEVLAVRDRGQYPCQHVGDLIERHAGDLAERIDALERMRRDLQRLARKARSADPREARYCHIIEEAP